MEGGQRQYAVHLLVFSIPLTCTMMLSLDAASWASFTQRLTTSKLHFSRCCGQWDLVRGQKERYPSCQTPIISHMQPGPPHCPEPKIMDGLPASCYPHSPQLADFLPDACPDNLHVRDGSKPLTPALPNGPKVSTSPLTMPSAILLYLQSSHSYVPGKTRGQSWRHWVPCPQLLVSCSAQQPAAWCSVIEECELRRGRNGVQSKTNIFRSSY